MGSRVVSFRLAAATALVAALVASVSTVTLASHQFDDARDGTFFHEAIGNIVAAGCAVGFNDDTFRPANNTTRGQFAFWMSNCGGRVGHSDVTANLTPGAPGNFTDGQPSRPSAQVSIEAGAAGSGEGFVVIMTTWTARPVAPASAPAGATTTPRIQFAGGTVCPCNVETGVNLQFAGAPATADIAASADSWDSDFIDERSRMSGAATDVVAVNSGDRLDLTMFAGYTTNDLGADDIDVDLSLTALYVPMGFDGSQLLLPN